MQVVKKGTKNKYDGVLLTVKEYERYKKLLDSVELFKRLKQSYDNGFEYSL